LFSNRVHCCMASFTFLSCLGNLFPMSSFDYNLYMFVYLVFLESLFPLGYTCLYSWHAGHPALLLLIFNIFLHFDKKKKIQDVLSLSVCSVSSSWVIKSFFFLEFRWCLILLSVCFLFFSLYLNELHLPDFLT
jgi:hypothetical protein